jgi:hypothetical protein
MYYLLNNRPYAIFLVNYCGWSTPSTLQLNVLHAICSEIFKIVETIKGVKCEFPCTFWANGLKTHLFSSAARG